MRYFFIVEGNLLCVTTLFDLLPTRIHLSVCVHLVALSALDSIVLCLRAGNDFVRCTWSFGVTEWILLQSEVTCQVFFFFSSFVQHLDSWIFVLAICQDASTVASDLLMTSTSSTTTKSRSAFSRAVNRSKHSILVVILFLVCANAHYFWTHGRWSPNPNEKNKALFCSFTQYGGMERKCSERSSGPSPTSSFWQQPPSSSSSSVWRTDCTASYIAVSSLPCSRSILRSRVSGICSCN